MVSLSWYFSWELRLKLQKNGARTRLHLWRKHEGGMWGSKVVAFWSLTQWKPGKCKRKSHVRICPIQWIASLGFFPSLQIALSCLVISRKLHIHVGRPTQSLLKDSVKSILYFLQRRAKLIFYDLMQQILLVADWSNRLTDAKKLSLFEKKNKNIRDVTESEAG